MSVLKNYLRDTCGNLSFVFALSASMLTVGVGAAIEIGNMTSIKKELQAQVDAATLVAAIATQPGQKADALDYPTLAYDVMVNNGYNKANGKPIATRNGNFLNVMAAVDYAGLFTYVLGKKTYKIAAAAQATLPTIGPLEMVLVLDNTASMGFDGKIGALKIGAGKIVDAVEASGSGAKIGLVPFARYINVGDADGTWLDKPTEYEVERVWQQATHTDGVCTTAPTTELRDGVEYTYDKKFCPERTTTYETRSVMVDGTYRGCVGTTDEPNHLDPISSSNKAPGLLTVHRKEVTGLNIDIGGYCPTRIRPLDNDYGQMGNFVNNMYPTDVTYIPSGLLWGERLLDRTVAFKQDPKEEGVRQIMILMTDGKNTAEIRNKAYHRDRLLSPPYIFNDMSDDTSVPKADADTLLLCERIKDKGIELFTISFKIDDAAAKTLVKDCATSTRHHFDAGSNDALIKSFEQIGKELSSGVIRLTL